MSNINVLDSSIYNRISAGEVVERPRSVVKELVENAIDAGSTIINISIEGGGIKSITVSDNGIGIDKDNIKKAFLPHATSKINSVDDLDKISTLGFRGEALASIAAVAQVTIKSKTKDSDGATMLEVNGGVFGEITKCALNVGTTIEVKNLFFNTPVRAKFLKKPKSEENEISSCIKEFILTNPDIVFIYKVDGKVIYQNSGASMEDALYAVYNREIVDKFIPFDQDVHGIRLYGYVASPEVSKPTRNYQTIIVNGRFIKDSSISTAVQTAFGERLMKRCFPVFILNMIVPFDEVDVNVHPSKAEVRFQDNRRIFGAVYRAINDALNMGQTIFSIKSVNDIDDDTIIEEAPVANSEFSSNEKIENHDDALSPQDNYKESSDINVDVNEKPVTFESLTGDRRIFDNSSFNRMRATSMPHYLEENNSPISSKKYEQYSFIDESLEKEANGNNNEDNKIILKDYRIVGQIFNAFLLVEYNGDVLLMDQHACHERLLYDKLIAQLENKKLERQQLMLPYILKVSPEDDSFINDNMQLLNDMGFNITPFRDFQYRVDSIPLVLGQINLEMFFSDFLSEKNKYRQLKFVDLIHNKLATTACKAAIKAGNVLSSDQIKMLLDIFTENEIPLQCPHGRPAVIKITRKDIDKLFKRIV